MRSISGQAVVARVGMWLCCRDEAGTLRPRICDVEACVISQRPARHPLADVAWRFHDLPNCAIFLPDRSFIVRGTFSWPELVERWLHTIGRDGSVTAAGWREVRADYLASLSVVSSRGFRLPPPQVFSIVPHLASSTQMSFTSVSRIMNRSSKANMT